MADNSISPEVEAHIRRGKARRAAAEARREQLRRLKFDTIAVHGLYDLEAAAANQGSFNEPLYLSPAEVYEDSAHLEAALAYLTPAWIYSRFDNPTVAYLEQTLALLEGYGFDGRASALATASGMAAIFMATMPFLSLAGGRPAPMNIVASAQCYGGTFTLFQRRYAEERGVEVRWVRDPLDAQAWEAAVDEDTRFVYGEMPSNPVLAVMDVAAVAEIAHQFELPLIVDATVATPALLRPLTLGADIIVHSVSKSMAASGLAIAGAVIARHDLPLRAGPADLRADFATHLKQYAFRDHGPGLSPFNALMALTDLRTLRPRMDRLSQNAMAVASFLADRPEIESVLYPGLPGTVAHPIAQRAMWLADGEDDYGTPVNRYGHLLSFTVRGGEAAARRVFDRFALIWRATDLGRLKSVATIPAISTHQQQGAAGRELGAVPPHLIRLSVGAEHPADVIADLDQALAAGGSQRHS